MFEVYIFFKKRVGLYVMHNLSCQTWAFTSWKTEHESFGKYADIFEYRVSYGDCLVGFLIVLYYIKMGYREDNCVIKGLLCSRKFTSKQLMRSNSNTALSSRIHLHFHWVVCPASMCCIGERGEELKRAAACFSVHCLTDYSWSVLWDTSFSYFTL